MHFVIIGAGALGSIYAAYLARAGHEITLLARGARAAQLVAHGVEITGTESFTAHPRIVTEPGVVAEADVAILTVKTYDTEPALAGLSNLRPASVFSVQNGVLKNSQLIEAFGRDATLGAVGAFGGEVLPASGERPGATNYTLVGPTVIGELDGGLSERTAAIERAMVEAGLKASASDDIRSVEWSKFVGWSGVSALAILTRLPTNKFLRDAGTARLVARVMRETGAVARDQGVTLADLGSMASKTVTEGAEDDAVLALQRIGEGLLKNAPDLRQSILQDADRGRRLEVNETLGHTLRLAEEAGLPCEMLQYCCAIMRTVSGAAT